MELSQEWRTGKPERADGIYNMVMGLGLGSSMLHREREDTFTRACVIFTVLYANGEGTFG